MALTSTDPVQLYRGLLDTMRDKLLQRLENLEEAQINRLLDATFPYIQLPELSNIAIAVLERHPKIPVPYLKKLSTAPLYVPIFQCCYGCSQNMRFIAVLSRHHLVVVLPAPNSVQVRCMHSSYSSSDMAEVFFNIP